MIYASREDAIRAVQEFADKVSQLEDEYDIDILSDDNYVSIYYSVKYLDENGKVQRYTRW